MMQPSANKFPLLREQTSQRLINPYTLLAYVGKSQFCPNCMLSEKMCPIPHYQPGKGLDEREVTEI